MEYKLFIDGQWVDGGPLMEVKNKYSGEIIGSLPTARREDLDAAIDAAQRAAPLMAEMPAYKRSEILARTASLIKERSEDFAKTIAAEAGKALKFARAEVERACNTFTIAAEEAKRLHGETIPLDAIACRGRLLRFLESPPGRRDCRHQPVQFPAQFGGPQGGAGPGSRKHAGAQTSQHHSADCGQVMPGSSRSRASGRRHQPGDRFRRDGGRVAYHRSRVSTRSPSPAAPKLAGTSCRWQASRRLPWSLVTIPRW